MFGCTENPHRTEGLVECGETGNVVMRHFSLPLKGLGFGTVELISKIEKKIQVLEIVIKGGISCYKFFE